MKKRYLFLTLVSILTSCQNFPSSENINTKNSSNESTSEKVSSTSEIIIPDGYYQICDSVYVNHKPGIYRDEISVEFLITDSNLQVYYTDTFDKPEIHDFYLYKRPFVVDSYESDYKDDYPLTISVDGILKGDTEGKCVSNKYNENIQRKENYYLLPLQTVINFLVYDKTNEQELLNRTLTYIIDKEERFTSIPIVSLSMPVKDWFGDNGFYNKIREDIKKRVHFEYYDPVYDEYFYRNSQVKLGGNWSLGYPQRTLNLNFNKDENGNKNEPVAEHIFGERNRRDGNGRLTDITRIRLHNGGNCFEEYTGFNDALLQTLMDDSYACTTGYRPCIAYLNGEYWGIYAIREHYKDAYIENNYGIKKKNMVFYEYKGQYLNEDGDEIIGNQLISELDSYVNNNDFSKNEVYEKFINEYIDEDSFIDVFLANAYSCNWDFVGNANNLKLWRSIDVDESNPYADGKWRFCLHDTDFAFREDVNYLDKNHQHSYSKYNIFKALMKNKTFKDKFYSRAEYLINNNFSEENSKKVFKSMLDEVKDYKLESSYRWGQDKSYNEYWQSQIDYVNNYFKTKSKSFLSLLKETMKQY